MSSEKRVLCMVEDERSRSTFTMLLAKVKLKPRLTNATRPGKRGLCKVGPDGRLSVSSPFWIFKPSPNLSSAFKPSYLAILLPHCAPRYNLSHLSHMASH